MRIYIAAPWLRRTEARLAARSFRDAGFDVISRWLEHPGDPNDSLGYSLSDEDVQQQAREDWQDVADADVLVVLNLEKSEGKAVETGIAIANGIPFICVGPRTNVFQTLGIGMVDSVEDAIAYLKTVPLVAA